MTDATNASLPDPRLQHIAELQQKARLWARLSHHGQPPLQDHHEILDAYLDLESERLTIRGKIDGLAVTVHDLAAGQTNSLETLKANELAASNASNKIARRLKQLERDVSSQGSLNAAQRVSSSVRQFGYAAFKLVLLGWIGEALPSSLGASELVNNSLEVANAVGPALVAGGALSGFIWASGQIPLVGVRATQLKARLTIDRVAQRSELEMQRQQEKSQELTTEITRLQNLETELTVAITKIELAYGAIAASPNAERFIGTELHDAHIRVLGEPPDVSQRKAGLDTVQTRKSWNHFVTMGSATGMRSNNLEKFEMPFAEQDALREFQQLVGADVYKPVTQRNEMVPPTVAPTRLDISEPEIQPGFDRGII